MYVEGWLNTEKSKKNEEGHRGGNNNWSKLKQVEHVLQS